MLMFTKLLLAFVCPHHIFSGVLRGVRRITLKLRQSARLITTRRSDGWCYLGAREAHLRAVLPDSVGERYVELR